MVDITPKSSTLRIAIAQAIVNVSSQATIDAIVNKTVPKGDVFEMAKTAGLFAVKRTSDMLPDCHPLPIESTKVNYSIDGLTIRIEIEVKTIYKTGVEVEAMHGASVIALTMYDMLKPIDKEISISDIQLVKKKGGKSDFNKADGAKYKAHVIVCSDSIAAGKKEDKAGKAIIAKLDQSNVQIAFDTVIPDEPTDIQSQVNRAVEEGIDMIIFTGGTGLSKRDQTPETIIPMLDRQIPGIEEAVRSYGQQRTPYSMLSRSVAGVKENTLILALPGSTNGAKESMDALFPSLLHIFHVIHGGKH